MREKVTTILNKILLIIVIIVGILSLWNGLWFTSLLVFSIAVWMGVAMQWRDLTLRYRDLLDEIMSKKDI